MRLAEILVIVLVLAFILALVFGLTMEPAYGAESVDPPAPLRPLFDAIWQEEASGELEPEDGKKGEIGPYQIRWCYWSDAEMPDGDYQDCRKKEYAERVMVRYWQRYGAKTDEQRARMHNGGPHGHKKKSTLDYWQRVKANMEGDDGGD